MKKLLRDKATGAFLTPGGEWTQDKTSACDFFNHRACFDLVEVAKAKELEWYYWFEGTSGSYDFTSAVDWQTLTRS